MPYLRFLIFSRILRVFDKTKMGKDSDSPQRFIFFCKFAQEE